MRPKRACLPSPEREAYVDEARESGVREITARCKNRYIDEFLRFYQERSGQYELKKLDRKTIDAFLEHLYDNETNRNTATTKMTEVRQWLGWLAERSKVRKDLLKGFDIAETLDKIHATKKRYLMDKDRYRPHRTMRTADYGDVDDDDNF